MTSIFDALTQLFTRWGIGLRYIQWCVAGVLGGYVGLAVLSVFLSSWGFQWLIWIFLAFYVFGVMNLLASPFLWGGVAGAAYVRGQVGGQEGLSVEDGINTVKDWGGKAIKGTSKFLLFYGAVPFIWTALFQTKGWEQENLVALIVLPTVIYFSLVRWPDSQSVFNTIGYVLIAAVLVGVLGTIYNTVQRSMADPSTLILLEHQQVREREAIEREARVAKDLQAQLDRGEAFTAEQKAVWRYLEQKRQAQSLRLKDMKSNVEQFVGEANPTDKSWWKQHWLLIGALVVGSIILVVYGRKKFAGGSGSAGAAHAAPAGGHTTKKGWVGKIIVILLLAGFGYLYLTDQIGYSKTIDVSIADLSDQEVCGLPANTRMVFRPVSPVVVEYGRPNDGFIPIDIANVMRVKGVGNPNNTLAGEPFITSPKGCVMATPDVQKGFQKEAVLNRVKEAMAKYPRGMQLRFESAWRPSW